VCYFLGGTKAANARSAVRAWPRILAFLQDNLRSSSISGRARV
jgi:hypothetical protein